MRRLSSLTRRLPSPIFIVGANRSGTTLLRLLLNAHSRIAIPEELSYFKAHIAGVPLAQWRAPNWTPSAYAAFARRFAQSAGPHLPGLNAEALEHDLLHSDERDLRHPYAYALSAWAWVQGKARWGEKTPGNLFYVDVILAMFPDAQFIYIARDPRAGVHSMMNTTLFPNDAAINALNRRKYATRGLLQFERAVPPAQRMIVRYEDLVAHTGATMTSICTFLGEPFESESLRFHETSERFMKPRATQDFNRTATMPIDAVRVNAWKTHLSRDDVAIIEALCAREMARFGYTPSGTALRLGTLPGLFSRWAYWTLQDWRHRHAPHFILQDRVLERSRRRLQLAVQRVPLRPG